MQEQCNAYKVSVREWILTCIPVRSLAALITTYIGPKDFFCQWLEHHGAMVIPDPIENPQDPRLLYASNGQIRTTVTRRYADGINVLEDDVSEDSGPNKLCFDPPTMTIVFRAGVLSLIPTDTHTAFSWQNPYYTVHYLCQSILHDQSSYIIVCPDRLSYVVSRNESRSVIVSLVDSAAISVDTKTIRLTQAERIRVISPSAVALLQRLPLDNTWKVRWAIQSIPGWPEARRGGTIVEEANYLRLRRYDSSVVNLHPVVAEMARPLIVYLRTRQLLIRMSAPNDKTRFSLAAIPPTTLKSTLE